MVDLGVVALGVSFLIALIAFVMGRLVLQKVQSSFNMNEYLMCATSGLLTGLGFLVMLPESIQDPCANQLASHAVFGLFIGTVIFMFFLENILLPHQHAHGHGHSHGHSHSHSHSPRTSLVPDGGGHQHAHKHQHATNLDNDRADDVDDDADDDDSNTLLGKSHNTPQRSTQHKHHNRECNANYFLGVVALVLQLVAWMLHAILDGMLIGLESVSSAQRLTAVAVAVGLCAVQDTLGFAVFIDLRSEHTDLPVPHINLRLALLGFTLCFPLGTLLGTLVRSNDQFKESGTLMRSSRCVMAGVFVYIALFEMMPPGTHDRMRNLKRLTVFVAALGSAFLIEMLGG